MTTRLEALLVDHSRRAEPVLARALDEAGYQAVLKPVGGEGDLREAVHDAGWEIVFSVQPDGPLALHDLVRVLRDVGTDLPIVVLSSTPGEDAAVEALARGADDYLVLPTLSRLGTAVERSLAAAASRRARAAERLALAESEKHFRRLFDLASIGLAEIDPRALRIVRANRVLGRIAGCPVSELQAVPITAFFPPEHVQLVREQVNRYASRAPASGGPFEQEVVRLDGTRVWVSINLNVQADADGRTVRLLAAIEDITRRKLVEEEQRRLITAVEQAAEAILITDTVPRIVYVNPAFERISGYAREEVLGQNPSILKSGHHDAAFYERMWRALREGRSWSGLVVNKRRNGTFYYEEATISPVFDAAGRAINYVAVKRDVTFERQVEAQFRQSQKLEAIGQLAGGIAHDFNNILSVIKGHAELLGTVPSTAAVRDAADEITRAADRAAGLTRQLLLFGRRQPPQLSPVDLNEVVSNVSRMLQRILGEDIDVRFAYADEPLPIVVDAGMMDQVLLNLAVNARDAMPRGGRLEVGTGQKVLEEGAADLPPGARPGTYACLTVVDTGEGIPPEVLPRVFEPFFTTKEVGKGTGLGLSTVLGIVQQHGGWVEMRSEIGHGTRVTVCIPRTTVAAGPQVMLTAAQEMPRGEETILLAEDDAALRRLVRTILSGLGYRVLEASSGRDALGVWTQHQHEIKLLLTDLVMPDGMSGLELAKLLLGHNPRLKVIYSSGYSPDIAAQGVALREGVNFLTKPYSPQTLAETVRARLSEGE